jgi:hypothetical protein
MQLCICSVLATTVIQLELALSLSSSWHGEVCPFIQLIWYRWLHLRPRKTGLDLVIDEWPSCSAGWKNGWCWFVVREEHCYFAKTVRLISSSDRDRSMVAVLSVCTWLLTNDDVNGCRTVFWQLLALLAWIEQIICWLKHVARFMTYTILNFQGCSSCG